MTFELDSRLATITRPLGPESPYGEDAKYDEMYLDLRAEIQKLTASSSKETSIDWNAITSWSIEILTTRSKDLTVAAYLTMALFVLEGYRGVRSGLLVLDELTSKHWDGVLPLVKQTRARALIFDWLVTRLGPLIEDRRPGPDEHEHLRPIAELVESIRQQVSERCGHRAPGFGELAGAVAARVEELGEPSGSALDGSPASSPSSAEPGSGVSGDARPGTAGPAARDAQPAAAPTAPGPGQGDAGVDAAADQPPTVEPVVARPASSRSEAAPAATAPVEPDERASFAQLRGRLLQMVAPIRAADPLHPLAYRLLRSIRWDAIDGPPAADPGSGKTRLPPPRPQARAALDAHLKAERWQELLQASEGAFQEPSGTFWLDLQHYTVLSLEHLDPSGESGRAASTVRGEVARFVERCSGLQQLRFADDSPMVAESTREWLTEVSSSQGADLLAAPPAAGGKDDESALEPSETQEALQLLSKKQPAAAFAILQAAIDRAPNVRARFRTSMAASRVCLQSGQTQWARTLLEDLYRRAESFSFETWQPETAVELHQLLAICYGRLAKSRRTEDRQGMRDRYDELVERLFQLDMQAAAAVHEQI